LPPRDMTAGVVMVLLLGLVAGLWPAVSAMNLKITDALRRN
jgi:ABC-type lipoprotein release transport system permease subunit